MTRWLTRGLSSGRLGHNLALKDPRGSLLLLFYPKVQWLLSSYPKVQWFILLNHCHACTLNQNQKQP